MENKLKRDSLYGTLKRQIYSGYLVPGSRLIELDLASQYQVSRTIVREVIKQLEVEGLVDLVPYKGAAVAKMSIKDLEEIYRIQQDLEGLAACLATPHLTEKHIAELDRVHQEAKGHIRDDVAGWQRRNTRFHRIFLENCGNERLLKLVENHRDQFARYWFLLVSIPGRVEQYMDEHERIIAAVRVRKPVLVRYLMERHIGGAARQLLEIMRNAYPTSFTM